MKCYIRKILVVSGIAALCLGAMLWSASAVTGTTRHYYVAAEEATWDYAPSGEDRVHGGPIPEP